MSDYVQDDNRYTSAAIAAEQDEDDHDLYAPLSPRNVRNVDSPPMSVHELAQETQPATLDNEDGGQSRAATPQTADEVARFAAQYPPGPFTVTFPSAAAYVAAVSPMRQGKTRTASEAAMPSRHAKDASIIQERYGQLAHNGVVEARRSRLVAGPKHHLSALRMPAPPMNPRAASDAAKFHKAAALLQQSTQMLEEIANDGEEEDPPEDPRPDALGYLSPPPQRAPSNPGGPASPTASDPAPQRAGNGYQAYEAPTPPSGGTDVFYIKQEPLTDDLQRLLYERPDREPSPSIQLAQRRGAEAPHRPFFNMPAAPATLQSTAPATQSQRDGQYGTQPAPATGWHEWTQGDEYSAGRADADDGMVIDVDEWAASQNAYTAERQPGYRPPSRAKTTAPQAASRAAGRRAGTRAPSLAPQPAAAVSHGPTTAPAVTSAPSTAPFPPPARPFSFTTAPPQPAPLHVPHAAHSVPALFTQPARPTFAFPMAAPHVAQPRTAPRIQPAAPVTAPVPPPPVDLSLHPAIARGNGKIKASANNDLIDGMPHDGHLANLRATQRRAWVKYHGPKMVFWCDNFDGYDPSQMDPSAATTKLENALAALFGDGSQPKVTWAESEPGSKTPIRKNTFLLKNITFEQMLFLLLRRRLLVGPAAITTFRWDLPASPYIGTFVGSRLNNGEIKTLVIDVWSVHPTFASIFDRSMPQGQPSNDRKRQFFKEIKVESDCVTANDEPVFEHRVYGPVSNLTPALRAELRSAAAAIVLEHDFKGSASIRSPEWFCQTCDRTSHARNACRIDEELPGFTRASASRAHQQP
ncbi:hypothetical protein AURDEDRAFT_173984, partial [Auricularia subglabra TFB-10046 SS5]